MDAFTIGITVLFISTAIFYVVLFSFIYYWHLKKTSYVIVPMIWTFEFFVIGFFIVAITSIIINYLPMLTKIVGT